MRRYWDHTAVERAKLTEEQVTELLGYELMEKGVLKVEPPVFQPLLPLEMPKRPVVTLAETDRYHQHAPLAIGFDTVEQAEACRGAIRYIREAAWNEGPRVRAVGPLQIVTEELPNETDFAARRSIVEENQRREAANSKARLDHEAACKKVADATADVWVDWRACRMTEGRREQIRKTFAEYLKMTDNNASLARAFLTKAYPDDDIAEALGGQVPKAEEDAR